MAKEFNVIGRRDVRRFDSYAKATGQAKYTRDIALVGMLHGKILRSPYAHARIKSMDTSKAEALPGVKAIITYKDKEVKEARMPGPDASAPQPIPFLPEEPGWEGEEAGAAVAAESEEIADEALKLIDVEWQELPFFLDPEEALKPDAPLLHPELNPENNLTAETVLETGDVEKGFGEADIIFEGTVKRPIISHAGAEPDSVVANWESEQLTVWLHAQDSCIRQTHIADMVNLPMAKVKVILPYQGGTFGQQCDCGSAGVRRLGGIAALLSKKTGRPVSIKINRREDFFASDIAVTCKVKVGIKKSGLITAIHLIHLFSGGQEGGASRAWGHFSSHTLHDIKCHNILVEDKISWVNKPPVWWFRSEANAPTFIFGAILNRAAEELGMDPTEVMLINAANPGPSLEDCIKAGKKAIDWDNKWHAPGIKQLPNGKMHGMGFFSCHEWGITPRKCASMALTIHQDGSLQLLATGGEDMGTDPRTTYAMVAAEELGMRIEDVYFPLCDTDSGHFIRGHGGSSGCMINSLVTKEAAQKARMMLLEKAACMLDVTTYELDIKDSVIYVKTNPEKKLAIKDVVIAMAPDGSSHKGLQVSVSSHGGVTWPVPPNCYQAHFCEVEVDTETGQVEVKKIVNVNDVGKAINPRSCNGQQYGGTSMALGRAIFEELLFDKTTGVRLNANLLDYKYPTILDCGPIETILKESGLGPGPYGTTGIGEDCATVVDSCIAHAIQNAIGVRIDDLPITPDKILKALGKTQEVG